MPVVPVNLVLDEKTYAGVLSGALELGGLVKDKELKRVRKHLPAVARETKSGVAKVVAVVKDHKGAAIGIGVGAAVLAAGVGVVTYFTQKDKRKAEKKFSKSLHVYLQAAQEGKITVEIVESLITDLDVVSQFNENKEMPLKLTAKELTTLFYSIYDFTKRLAEANHISVDDLKAPKRFKKNTVVDLQNYLKIQKEILERAA